MDCEIRPARPDDAEDISRVILRTLHETNSDDYSREIVERVAAGFSPAAVLLLIEKRKVFVAILDRRLVGTASLDGRALRTMFVAPDVQKTGIGRLLFGEVERAAREKGLSILVVPSSVTAEAFYIKLGFRPVRDQFFGDERTIIMERSLEHDAEDSPAP